MPWANVPAGEWLSDFPPNMIHRAGLPPLAIPEVVQMSVSMRPNDTIAYGVNTGVRGQDGKVEALRLNLMFCRRQTSKPDAHL